MKLGFDFGTSYCAMAVCRNGSATPVHINGQAQIRSMIYFPPPTISIEDFDIDGEAKRIADVRAAILSSLREQQKGGVSEADIRSKYARSERVIRSHYTGSELERELGRNQQNEQRELELYFEQLGGDGAEIDRQAVEQAKKDWFEQESRRGQTLRNVTDAQINEMLVGEDALDEYLHSGGEGILLYSPKLLLALDVDSASRLALERVLTAYFRHALETARSEGGDVERVVFGLPAPALDDAKQQRVREAAKASIRAAADAAGMRNIAFLDEPAAAAFHLHHDADLAGRALLVDLGGGTSDLALVELGGSSLAPVVSKSWGCRAGGTDVDERIVAGKFMPFFGKDQTFPLLKGAGKIFADAAMVYNVPVQLAFRQHRLDGITSPYRERLQVLQKGGGAAELSVEAEKAKVSLGRESSVELKLDKVFEGLEAKITQSDLIELSQRYLDKLKELLSQVDSADFEHIILTGGMANAVGVRDMIERVFPSKRLVMTGSSGDVVSGLAVYAAQIE